MDIESILRRDGGTKVEIGTRQYHFLPSAAHDGAHVAEVTDPGHLGILLGIPEGYRVAVAPGAEPAPAPVQPAIPARSVDAGDFLAAAAASADAAAAAAEQEPAAEPADETPVEPVAAARLDDMDHDALVAEFERLEGRKPHHAIKTETLRDKLKELAAQA